MNIQLEKDFIIEQLKHVNDADLIHALKSLLTYSMKKEDGSNELLVPEWHKEIVRQRLAEAKAHPEKLISWDEIMKELEN